MRYLVFNKPFQVLCQFTRGADAAQRTLADYIAVPEVYPAGRLDFDSEGLVLLTDDGRLQHRLNHPKFAHRRTYWVQVEGTASDAALDALRQGLRIQDYQTRPAEAKVLDEPQLMERVPPIRYRKHIPTSWLEIILSEGRNRQVRRMTAAIGLPTLRLLRVAIGNLKLNDLAPGQWRDLAASEIGELRVNSGKRPNSSGNGKVRSRRN